MRTGGGLEEEEKDWRRIGGLEEDWRRTGGGLEEDWKRVRGGREEDRRRDWRRIGRGLEEDWRKDPSSVQLNELTTVCDPKRASTFMLMRVLGRRCQLKA